MLKKIGLGIIRVIVAVLAVTTISYLISRSSKLEDLKSGSRVANTEYGQIEYRIVGDSGPFILYFHGTPGGYDAPVIRIPEMRTIVPSRPGYLRTPLEVGQTPAEQATAFAGLLDALELESVVVLGGSGGGPYAIAFAALFPDRTDGLITIAGNSLQDNLPEDLVAPIFIRSDFLYWMLTSWITRSRESTVQTIVPKPDNQNKILADPNLADALADIAWTIWPFSLREHGWTNDVNQLRELNLPIASITVPTLIIQGTEDINVPLENGLYLAEQIENSTLLAVEGADHMVSLSHRSEVNTAISEFLESLAENDI